MDNFAILVVCFANALFGIFVGTLIGGSFANNSITEDCRKQHNVYECVIIAIPKGKEGVYGD
jgi:Na+/glutamate symporter